MQYYTLSLTHLQAKYANTANFNLSPADILGILNHDFASVPNRASNFATSPGIFAFRRAYHPAIHSEGRSLNGSLQGHQGFPSAAGHRRRGARAGGRVHTLSERRGRPRANPSQPPGQELVLNRTDSEAKAQPAFASIASGGLRIEVIADTPAPDPEAKGKRILIYHTHTHEAYAQTRTIPMRPSRAGAPRIQITASFAWARRSPPRSKRSATA